MHMLKQMTRVDTGHVLRVKGLVTSQTTLKILVAQNFEFTVYHIPYTAKLSSGKTFAVFAVFCSTANVLRRIG